MQIRDAKSPEEYAEITKNLVEQIEVSGCSSMLLNFEKQSRMVESLIHFQAIGRCRDAIAQ